MNKIEEIKKELEKNLGYNFNNWGKGDLQMLKEIINANDKVVENLALCAVSQQRELLNAFVDKYNDRVYGDKRICNDEVGIYLDSI